VDNELSAFGYNRDGKQGKRQIVIGLLCNEEGIPLSIEVFSGNTQDPKTFGLQIKKVAERFGTDSVTFVGDRGMIKGKQIEDLNKEGFHYITAITKAQIKTLLREGTIQMGLFESELAEVETEEGIRYVIRCNPVRAQEIRETRQEKIKVVQEKVEKYNEYLRAHQKAKVGVGVKKIKGYIEKLKVEGWVVISAEGREIRVQIDEEALREEEKLDGCYVLKTDLVNKEITKEIIHRRYKDLALVEEAFRSIKTVQLEMRPIHVRLATRTRGHALVVMLAYRIIKELADRWEGLNITVGEGIKELATLCANEVSVEEGVYVNEIPVPRESVKRLLDAAKVRLPKILPYRGIKVTTKKKLTTRRKNL